MCIQRTRDGFVLVRQARTKITTFLASIITCCIVPILFCSNYYGGDSNNHIINSAFAASVGEGSQNQLPSQQQQCNCIDLWFSLFLEFSWKRKLTISWNFQIFLFYLIELTSFYYYGIKSKCGNMFNSEIVVNMTGVSLFVSAFSNL